MEHGAQVASRRIQDTGKKLFIMRGGMRPETCDSISEKTETARQVKGVRDRITRK